MAFDNKNADATPVEAPIIHGSEDIISATNEHLSSAPERRIRRIESFIASMKLKDEVAAAVFSLLNSKLDVLKKVFNETAIESGAHGAVNIASELARIIFGEEHGGWTGQSSGEYLKKAKINWSVVTSLGTATLW